MAAGDWLLGCVPLQAGDAGMFDRACYLSGGFGGFLIGAAALYGASPIF